jgi:hypothetical protein
LLVAMGKALWLLAGVALASCSLDREGVLDALLDSGAAHDAALGGQGGQGGHAGAAEDAGSDSESDARADDATAEAPADVAPPSCSVFSPNAVSLVIGTELHCYWRSATTASFSDARAACLAQNGQLASALTQAENDTIRSIPEPLAVTPDVWLGASDGKGELEPGVGAWAWLSGEPFSFAPWAPDSGGEPDGFCESCPTGGCMCHHVLALRLADGLWFDRWQGNLYAYVCEAVAGPI